MISRLSLPTGMAVLVLLLAPSLPTPQDQPGGGQLQTIPVWWRGPNGGICDHAANGAVQCRPAEDHPPNPDYYHRGRNWVAGHWFRGRWIGGHWS